MAATLAKLEQAAAQLEAVSESLSSQATAELPPTRAKWVRKTITEAYETLRMVVDGLDPNKQPGFVFDRSNPNVAGRIVAITMVAQTRKPLAQIDRFNGSGVYALYYNGYFPPYSGIANREHPFYVGEATSTLKLSDFEYRAIVVQTDWQTAAEDYLIHLFKPVWNSKVGICCGFGKHGDDPATRANLRSPWDTLHPGRDWQNGSSRKSSATLINTHPSPEPMRSCAASLKNCAPHPDNGIIMHRN